MPRYQVIYKQIVTLCGEVEAERLEDVFEQEIICLGPGSDEATPEIRFLSVEELIQERA